MNKLGLVGKQISYSFSNTYFKEKFEKLNITDTTYQNFDLDNISEFPSIFKNHPEVKGLNVTIPYKEQVIPFLDSLNEDAANIGAVNTIKLTKEGTLVGYNTDYYGFQKSIENDLKPHHTHALILGTGGASKAIAFALSRLNIEFKYVSRSPKNEKTISYTALTVEVMDKYTLIINCSPVGTFPNVNDCPDIPYEALTDKHLLFDLIYNPSETTFLRKGREQNTTILNGLKMLEYQAEKAWDIWNL
ncbi:shikimate 5-dehydrogenase [Formosa agariphila KMM 3901]|uniref:Shikimate 5-dehydrogenase n=1 Tax=Formosa agariphila (strain DSM 15362 / KCTC 12365 / LMG 23005 / KMM 3901 / M-2Alg 35-1) TaxID=1347342 RepID=T2KJ62_FORAG|nr:shikimate dehydrogenase [Formosa agariphila]CDF78478.1 shikimate 5-dehydrogenase [Formosa agariphila KMM 3901]